MTAELTQPEQQVFEELKKVDHESLWGAAIRKVVIESEPDPLRFLRLIIQLKSQDRDNPEVMQKILGPAYDAVVKL